MKSKGEETKNKILETATDLIHRQGFGATTINDLLEATGIKKGSLYFHFASKDAIGLAILKNSRARFLDFLDRSLVGATPGERLDNFFAKVVTIHKGKGFVGGCIFGNIALEMGDTESDFAPFIEGVFEEWVERIQATVASAQDSGEVRSDIAADVLACQIVAAIEGGIMLSRLKKDEKPLCDSLDALRTMIRVE